jgi:1-acyl-sn-glycerol-3-phosphate acyltransferase
VIRLVIFLLVMSIVTPPMAVVAVIAPLLGASDRFFDRLGRLWCRCVLLSTGIRVRVEGTVHIPRAVPAVFISNHQSWFDVPALAIAVPQRYRFVAKQELRHVPLWGRAWQAAGHISIDRQDTLAAIGSLQRAGGLIRSDNSAIIIFPEGTRSPTDEMLPFKKGAFRLAQSLGVVMIPVAIVGSRRIMPKGSWRMAGGEIIVRFGPPIPTWEYGEDRMDALMDRARAAIERLRTGRNPIEDEQHGTNRQHTRT